MRIAIPSYKRPEFIKNPECVYEQIKELDPLVVLRPEDAANYDLPSQHVAILPAGIQHIGDTRQWILEQFGHDGVLMLDDDTNLQTLKFDGVESQLFKCEKSFDIEHFKSRLNELEKAGPWGFLMKATMWSGGVYRGVRPLGTRIYYETSYFRLKDLPPMPDISQFPLGEDAILCLYLGSQGIVPNMVGDVNVKDITSRSRSKPTGGTWTYREIASEEAIEHYTREVERMGYPKGIVTSRFNRHRGVPMLWTDRIKVIQHIKAQASIMA